MQQWKRTMLTGSGTPDAGEATPRLGKTPKWTKCVVSALLAVHAGLLAYGAHVHSPTNNEPAHLVAGITYWQFGRTDVYNVNPPLVRMVAAVPVLIGGCETDWKNFREAPGARPEWTMGVDFCNANGYRTFWLMTMARWACIPFSLLGGFICFRWASELYGVNAGLLPLTLWCFCPNVIAHGQLITCDVAATALAVAACYIFWHWLKQPTWWNTLVSGAVLGIAEVTKTTLVIFYPLWPVVWFLYRWPARSGRRGRDWAHEFIMLCSCMLVALYFTNLAYGLDGSFMRLGDFTFVSRALTGGEDSAEPEMGGNRFSGSWLGKVPIPLPKNYVLGIDLQRKDFETFGQEFYLGGVWSETGWWYYYLYALAIKVPLGTWLIIVLAICARFLITVPAQFRDEFVLLTPALAILTFVSSQTGLNEHLRYVLPIFPFFFVWTGRITAGMAAVCETFKDRKWMKGAIVGLVAAVALLWSVCSSLWSYPHSLSYFNEIVGQPKNGWKYLIYSNTDWGEDLLYLKHWIDEHPEARPLHVEYSGPIDPALAGIQQFDGKSSQTLPHADNTILRSGWYAVSTNLLAGHVDGRFKRDTFRVLRDIPEYDLVGGSIRIYRLSQSELDKAGSP